MNHIEKQVIFLYLNHSTIIFQLGSALSTDKNNAMFLKTYLSSRYATDVLHHDQIIAVI